MVKKLLTIALGLMLSLGAMAQWGGGNATVPQDSIRFWTGTGANRAVIAVTWDDDDASSIGIAWGVQWSGSTIQLKSLMDTIAAYDSRVTLTSSSSFINNIAYNDSELGLNLIGESGWWWYNWKNANDVAYQSGGITSDMVHNGDFVDWMQMGAADVMLYATDPNASSQSANYPFPANNVEYWTGSGSNSAVVSFGFNGTYLVYGVRWNGSAHVSNLLDTINTADSRITISGISGCYASSINYYDASTNTEYEEQGMGWMYKVNGSMAGSICSQNAASGDYVLFSDNFSFPTGTYVYVSDPNASQPSTGDSVHYWVGTGDGSATVAIAWDESDTALLWGVHFDDDYYPSVIDLLDSIDTYDPRFDYHVSYYMSSPYNISSISYNEGAVSLSQTNTSNIQVRVHTTFGDMDAVSGSELEDYSVWDGDSVQISTSGAFGFGNLQAVEPPAETPQPIEEDTLCTTVYNLPYSMDFSGYTNDQSMRVYYSNAPVPDCWSLFGNGRFRQNYDTAANSAVYFGGIGYATSTNNYGCMEVGNPYLALIVCQNYDGTYESAQNNSRNYGNKRFAVLPAFDHPLSQTVLTFNHRCTASSGAALMVGFITGDTSSFVAVDSIPMDYRVTHSDTVRFSAFNGIIPADARLTFLWKSLDTAHTGDYPSNYYCGIDNILVEHVPEPPAPVEATIAAGDILYWVGTGSNQAILAVNWADTALAWGYRWNGTATVATMMADIAAADPRFSYTGTGFVNDIMFNDGTVNLAITPGNYWGSTNNGVMDMGMGQTLADGDFEKWGDPAAGVVVDSMESSGYMMYTYVYPMAIHPVSVPGTTVPAEATIAASDILYWVGEGTNKVVFAVDWVDSALAWGYKFSSDSVTVETILDAIAAADPRFSYSAGWGVDDIRYFDSVGGMTDTLHLQGDYWMYNVNGTPAMLGFSSQKVAHGDFVKFGDIADGFGYDYDSTYHYYASYVWTRTVTPVSVPHTGNVPVEATIAASDILYWVGEGSNRAILAVNWADTALAWGYRWNDTATVGDMLEAIAAADPRFSVAGTGLISDLNYIDTAAGMTDTLGITTGNWWASTNNGYTDMGAGQALNNGDFEKWADPAAGVLVDSVYHADWDWTEYIYVYPMTIHAVSVPDTTSHTPEPPQPEHGPYPGAAGTVGSTAIAADSSAIVAWATGVVITRGPQNISVEGSLLAGFGDESMAIGMATLNNTMEAVSLGDGGSALVTFATPIANGEGPDFAVFENGFGDNALELAFVEVSTDGQRFVRFPASCLTQNHTQLPNSGASDPTNLNNLAGKYRIGFGTPFDLEELRDSTGINIDSIVYVRVVDVVGCIDPQYGTRDASGRIINDPWPTPFNSSGFDLTGVAVLHEYSAQQGIADIEVLMVSLYPNPTSDVVNVRMQRAASAMLYDQAGRQVGSYELRQGLNTLNLSHLANGVYMLRAEGCVSKIVKR